MRDSELPRMPGAAVLALVAALESAARQAPRARDTRPPEPTAGALADLTLDRAWGARVKF